MFLSIMGMYEYDQSIFDGLDVPTYTDADDNVHIINKDDVINNIMLQCAELELIYSNIETMKLAIGVWSASEQKTWSKLFASQEIEYNPIWNVDANISQNRSLNRNRSGNNENIGAVQGFNASTWSNAEKDTGTYTDGEITGETFSERRTGNIGVTASQDLIKKEREIAEFNMIEYITESFKKRFCLMVY